VKGAKKSHANGSNGANGAKKPRAAASKRGRAVSERARA
jgi:hypothetical protein